MQGESGQMIESKIKKIINSHKIVIFTKSHCPYCRNTKEFFTRNGKAFHEEELTSKKDMSRKKTI